MDRYWWMEDGTDFFRNVKTGDPWQLMKKLTAYRRELTRQITSLFEVFSIEFAGPFPETRKGHKHLLICVENMMGWLIVVTTPNVTAKVVCDFLSTEIIHPFGIPKIAVSDNEQCFTSGLIMECTAHQGIQ